MKKFRIVKESPMFYRIDQYHSYLFGLIRYWDRGAYDLYPNVRFEHGVDAMHHILEKFSNSKITLKYIHKEGY